MTSKEIQNLKMKIRYYTNIQQTKELTNKQSAKLKEYTDKLHELEPNPKPKRKYNNYEEYKEANKKHSLERYYRIKAEREHFVPAKGENELEE